MEQNQAVKSLPGTTSQMPKSEISKQNDKNLKCSICNVFIGADPSVWAMHENGKRHKFNKFKQEQASRQINYYGFIDPSHYGNLKNYMERQCGIVEKLIFPHSGKAVFVRFQNTESADIALSKRLFFMNKHLNFKRQRVFDKPPSNIRKETAHEISKLPESIELNGNFNEKLDMFVEIIKKPTDGEQLHLQMLCQDLKDALNIEFPGCNIVPFGSSFTGLSFVSSDVDCFVDLYPEQMKYLLHKYDNAEKLHQELVKMCKRNLLKNKKFGRVFAIPLASIPIVKFLHIPTNTNCDVSFKGGFGIFNSLLLKNMINLDKRIRPLIMFIKYWAKHNGFIGYGGISSYALCILILYFLQTVEPSILPTVQSVQPKPDVNATIEGWNCGHDEILLSSFKTENDDSIIVLLLKFFSLYSSFNFSQKVISIYTGEAIEVDKFKKFETIPSAFKLYYDLAKEERVRLIGTRTHCIYVQDPFEQSRNVALSIGDSKLNHLQSCFDLLKQTIEKSVSESSENELFDQLLKLKMPPPKKVKNRTPQIGVTIPLKPEFYIKIEAEREIFFDDLHQTTEKLIKTILTPDVEEVPIIKTDVGVLWCKSYLARLSQSVWMFRKKVNVTKEMKYEALLEAEALMTASIIKKMEKNTLEQTLEISFYIAILNGSLIIKMSMMKGKSKDFNSFTYTFQQRIKNLFLYYLKKYD